VNNSRCRIRSRLRWLVRPGLYSAQQASPPLPTPRTRHARARRSRAPAPERLRARSRQQPPHAVSCLAGPCRVGRRLCSRAARAVWPSARLAQLRRVGLGGKAPGHGCRAGCASWEHAVTEPRERTTELRRQKGVPSALPCTPALQRQAGRLVGAGCPARATSQRARQRLGRGAQGQQSSCVTDLKAHNALSQSAAAYAGPATTVPSCTGDGAGGGDGGTTTAGRGAGGGGARGQGRGGRPPGVARGGGWDHCRRFFPSAQLSAVSVCSSGRVQKRCSLLSMCKQ